ncbi:MAG: ThiF family adenylyltransferase [Thermodesulfobacteriota bacterium]
MNMDANRHRKQELFTGLGPEGQAALGRASVLVAGCGALGGTIALLLVRAGVGRVRVVDRDFPELGNLGRQLLFTEKDLETGLPKAVLAEQALRAMNSEVKVEGVVAHIGPDNVLGLCEGMDLILDGLDNQETRYLLNDAAVQTGLPWIYAGCIGAAGNVMVIRPGLTPCLRCLFPEPAPPGTLPTCDTTGIIGPAASLTASVVTTEALKLLSGRQPARSGILSFDLWFGAIREMPLSEGSRENCPCCQGRRFDFLTGDRGGRTESMCGVDAVQVSAPKGVKVDLELLAGRLDPASVVSWNKYLLRFTAEGYYLAVFPDGRAIVHGTADHATARGVVNRWLGT